VSFSLNTYINSSKKDECNPFKNKNKLVSQSFNESIIFIPTIVYYFSFERRIKLNVINIVLFLVVLFVLVSLWQKR